MVRASVPVPETLRGAATLSDEQIRQVARTGLAVETAYGHPQDIEFCFDATGKLWLLQTRPVTTASEYGPAAGNHLIWDNSNIIESYSGVTSPMTFSFIRRAYTIVYHCFAEVMGIGSSVVRDNETVFQNMLGLFRGQVYYNLLNWYRLVRLFPGFAYNKQFMESMMGVKEPTELRDEYRTPTMTQRYFVELPRLVRLVASSTWNFIRIRRWVVEFEDNFRQHYTRWEQLDFNRLKPHELHALYREMETALLWNWRAPSSTTFLSWFTMACSRNSADDGAATQPVRCKTTCSAARAASTARNRPARCCVWRHWRNASRNCASGF